ncbi:MAG: PLP-dependent aminotransferase family protein [Chloroflexi bacterium]|nr:PLP-dependent aminotransferase family protein [Chloroflexota bacterium]
MDFSDLVLDKGGVTPLYRQLTEQIKAAVAQGKLTEGTRLPAIRNLARALGVSPITVTQAYEALATEGIANGQVGRGTFILPRSHQTPVTTEPASKPSSEVAGWQNEITHYLKQPTRLAEISRLMQNAQARWNGEPEDFISLTSGSPTPELFPIARFHQALAQAGQSLQHESELLFQYGPPLGDPTTRNWLATYLHRFGFKADPDEILLTTGSQQALDLIARVFLGPGESILVESPTYPAALDIFEQRGIHWLPIPLDREGLQVEQLARLAERYHPKLLYTIPTAQSPTGQTLSPERRRRVAELSRRYNFLVVEDDTCNEFYYGSDSPAALKSYDSDGHILYIKSFSKLIFPTVRIGCIVASPFLLEKLAEAKQIFDRSTSLPLARAVFKHTSTTAFEREIKIMSTTYRTRRDAFLAALEEELTGTGCSWTYPEAGFSLLLTLPSGLNPAEVHQAAAGRGLGIMPGAVFYPIATEAPASLRLVFSDNPPPRLEEAARRLGQVLRELLRKRSLGRAASNFVAAV